MQMNCYTPNTHFGLLFQLHTDKNAQSMQRDGAIYTPAIKHTQSIHPASCRSFLAATCAQ